MKKTNYNRIIFFIVLFYAITYAIVVASSGPAFTSDGRLHMRITQAWKDGHNPLIEKEFFGNAFPYPPAFHLTLALIPLDSQLIFALIQILIFPCLIMVTYWFTKQLYGEYAGVIAVALALSGFAFWDRPGQPIPNAPDLLLLPIVFYLYIKNKNIGFVLTSTYLIYNHLFYPMWPILGLFVHSTIKKREFTKNFLYIGILCLPLVYLYLPYMGDFMPHTAREQAIQQYVNFKNNPLWALCYLGYPLVISAFFTLKYFIKKNKTEIDWIMLVWLLSFIPMLIKFPHRATTYIAQPLAIMGGMVLSRKVSDSKKDLFLTAMLTIAALYALVQASYILPALRVPMVTFFNWLFIGWTYTPPQPL